MTERRENASQRKALHDPEPIAITGLILAGIAAATGVYAVGRKEVTAWAERRRKRRNLRSMVLRWEAELVDYGDLLCDLKEFLASASKDRNEGLLGRPLKPLEHPVFLDARELRKYRRLVGKLATHAKKLSDVTLDLLADIEDRKLVKFMEDSVPQAREILTRLKQMESLERVLAEADAALELLKRTATYLREQIVH